MCHIKCIVLFETLVIPSKNVPGSYLEDDFNQLISMLAGNFVQVWNFSQRCAWVWHAWYINGEQITNELRWSMFSMFLTVLPSLPPSPPPHTALLKPTVWLAIRQDLKLFAYWALSSLFRNQTKDTSAFQWQINKTLYCVQRRRWHNKCKTMTHGSRVSWRCCLLYLIFSFLAFLSFFLFACCFLLLCQIVSTELVSCLRKWPLTNTHACTRMCLCVRGVRVRVRVEYIYG